MPRLVVREYTRAVVGLTGHAIVVLTVQTEGMITAGAWCPTEVDMA